MNEGPFPMHPYLQSCQYWLFLMSASLWYEVISHFDLYLPMELEHCFTCFGHFYFFFKEVSIYFLSLFLFWWSCIFFSCPVLPVPCISDNNPLPNECPIIFLILWAVFEYWTLFPLKCISFLVNAVLFVYLYLHLLGQRYFIIRDAFISMPLPTFFSMYLIRSGIGF